MDDYDILGILGNSINSSIYKVKHKKSGKILVWRTVSYESSSDKECLLDDINKRSNICHPNVLNFYNYIDQEENKILYIVTEYCEKGSLKNFIELCSANKTYLSEELVCKILYQIALAIKTIDNYITKLSLKNIFLDEYFNVKLFNWSRLDSRSETLKQAKMYHLGIILYEICTFKNFDENTYIDGLKHVEKILSQSLLSLILYLVTDRTNLKMNINKILCHPTVLLKSVQWSKEKNLINIEEPEKTNSAPKCDSDQNKSTLHTAKTERLKKKENSLQIREQQLNEREYKLVIKEKKIALMERGAKEKLQQAELYLKRCRESKSVSNETTKSTVTQKQKKSYENLDSTYVSCDDSISLPTSSKLNVNKIIKPAPFTRTLSERRIRFKGHSPLKEIDFNKRSTKQSKSQKSILLKKKSDWLTCSDDTDKSSTEWNSKGTCNKAKQLFSTRNTYENDMQCKPIAWTAENKKYAFELLRVMNTDKENQGVEVKHTYL